MPTLQSQFIKFHDAIKLDADDKKVLIDKRKEVEEAINKGVSEFGKSFSIKEVTQLTRGFCQLMKGIMI